MSEKCYGKGSICPPPTPGLMRIYSMRFCPYSKRARLVLEHKNIPHETVNINLMEKPDWYSNGKVPMIELDDKRMHDSGIIVEYLDEAYQNDPLQPADPYEKAKDKIALLNFSKITELLYKLHYHFDNIDGCVKDTDATFIFYEDELTKRKSTFFGGEQPSLLDMMMWPWFETLTMMHVLHPNVTLEKVLPKENFANLRSWIDNMQMVPAVKKCSSPDSITKFLSGLKEGKRDFDAGL